MRRIVSVVAIGLVMWCSLGANAGRAQVVDSSRVRIAAAQSGQWVPARTSRAEPLQRKISLHLSGVPLADALETISREAGLRLGYSGEVRRSKIRVSLKSDDFTVLGALLQVLLGTGFQPFVSLRGNAVLVAADAPEPALAPGSIFGQVTDSATGHGVVGAEVFLEKTRWRTTTDTAGRYRLAEVDAGQYTLTVRRVGYAKQTREVTVTAEHTDTVNVMLKPVASRLTDLVTTATGAQRRRDIGNAITTINADSVMQTAPIRNLTDLLENRVTGLTVQHTSGAPGDPARLRLRGLNSVLRSNDPVVIVDGVRIYAAQAEARSGNLTNSVLANVPSAGFVDPISARPAPSPLDQIDPNIIEKIEVFKGPSAATLYGADAANGVIVITTKKGRPGPARWNGTLTRGMTDTPGQYPTGYYRWGHSIYDNASTFCTLVNTLCVQDSLVRYQALNDPAFTVLGRGHRTDGSLTASGGSAALQYSLTGSYNDEIGLLTLPAFEAERYQALVQRPVPDWMRRPHRYMNWSASSRITAQLGSTADVSLTTSLGRSEQSRTSLEEQVTNLASTYIDRVIGAYYNTRNAFSSQGSYSLNRTSDFLTNFYRRATASALTFTTGLQSTWRPAHWFSGSGQVGLNVEQRQDELLLPTGPLGFGSDSGSLVWGAGRSLVSTLNLQGTARKPLGRGFNFETSAGVNLTTNRTDDVTSGAEGLVPNTGSLNGARRFFGADAGQNASVFGWYIEPRVAGQRLSLSTGIRLDGGSAYGARITRQSGGLFGLLALPKLNGSWVISEEPWFPFKTAFSSLRLRGAYGQSQVQPGPADRLRLYQRTTDAAVAYVLTKFGNTQLRPERGSEFESGFDADLLDSRVSLEVTGYRKVQHDALMSVTLPGSVGGGSVLTNIGTIRNTGWDATVRLTPLRSTAATWTVQFLYSENSNLLVELGKGVAPNPYDGLMAGYPVGGRWERPIVAYADLNGNRVLDPGEVQIGDTAVYVGRLLPKSTTALTTNLALFGGAVGVNAGFSYNAGGTQIDRTAGDNWVLSRAVSDPGAPLGEQAAVLAAQSDYFGPKATQYGLIQEVSTFRFSTLSVNYRAPAAMTRLVRAQQLSVALQGSNLGVHSTYRGKDPDVNSWQPGEGIADTGQLPQPRTWQFSVYVTY